MRPLLAVLLACAGDPAQLSPEPVEVRAWLDGVEGTRGTLVVQTAWDPAGQVDLPEPAADGLDFEPLDEPLVERIGPREVVTRRYGFSGKKGSYEIRPQIATWRGPDAPVEAASSPLFVDLAVPPPRPAEPEDIVEPALSREIPWVPIGAVAAGVGVLGLGLWVAFGATRRRELPEAPPEPPDVIALRAWVAVRDSAELDDHAKARQLSRIFRDYVEAVLAFPAASWTTTEIVEHLRGMQHLPEGNVPRAKRLLRATDRVKYAEEDPEGDLFEELDADLRAFVGSTRPRSWDGEAQ